MSFISVPFFQLVVSEDNVRQSTCDPHEDNALRASILKHGLLNNLVVVPTEKPDQYAIVAGSRRYAALCDLIEAGELPKSYAIACHCLDDKQNGVAVSLSENITRADMSLLDEYEAFTALADQGKSMADIALQYGCSEYQVRQRLRLGRVAPEIRQSYRDGEMDIDDLIAFAISDDQGRQLAVFHEVKKNGQQFHAYWIKKALTDTAVYSDDKLVKFIGMDAYIAAGGTYTQDLFSNGGVGDDDDDWSRFVLHNADLVDQLVEQSLQTTADSLLGEGWKWTEICPQLGYGEFEKKYKIVDRLYPNDDDYTAEQKAQSGCIVTIDYAGSLKVERGLQRNADLSDAEIAKTEQDKLDQYSQSLQQSLTHQRLALLARHVANDWSAAQDILLCQMLRPHLDCYQSPLIGMNIYAEFDSEIDGHLSPLCPQYNGLVDLEAMAEADNPLEYVASLDEDTKQRLLSICTALLLQSNSEKMLGYLASRTQCDPLKQWRPTADNFWSRLNKNQIMAIGGEVLGEAWAKRHKETKKRDLTGLMQRIFAGDTVPGIRADQTARALAWIPPQMMLGEPIVLPPLSDNAVHTVIIDIDDNTGHLAVMPSSEPAVVSNSVPHNDEDYLPAAFAV